MKRNLERYEFVLLLVIMSKALSAIDIASQYLQSKEAELQLAVDYLAKAEQTMTIYRNQFNEVKDEAIAIFATWGLSEKFGQKQVCKIKCHFGELIEDNRLNNPADAFRVNVFYVTIDTVLAQLHQRFIATKEIIAKCSILKPVILAKMNSHLLLEKATQLQRDYETGLSAAFRLQILRFKESIQSEIAKLSTFKQLAYMLIVNNATVFSGFIDVIMVLILSLTLLVTVATTELSFSNSSS